jgi:hypothetical protein
MKLAPLSIEAVQSISQRSLLLQWNDLAGMSRFPAFLGFDLDARAHDPRQTIIWSVEGQHPARRFRAVHHGGNCAEAFHGSWVGKLMDEVAPECVRQFALDSANACVENGCAIYTVVSTYDAAGARVDCERLQLPYGGGGNEVCHIVASLQLISLEGSFDRKTVLDRYNIRTEVRLAGMIRSGFARPKVAGLRDRPAPAAGLSLPLAPR